MYHFHIPGMSLKIFVSYMNLVNVTYLLQNSDTGKSPLCVCVCVCVCVRVRACMCACVYTCHQNILLEKLAD